MQALFCVAAAQRFFQPVGPSSRFTQPELRTIVVGEATGLSAPVIEVALPAPSSPALQPTAGSVPLVAAFGVFAIAASAGYSAVRAWPRRNGAVVMQTSERGNTFQEPDPE